MLDEVDAALDKVNIARVCQYIRSRSRGGKLQSIVISLKDDFYDKADALVGVYRDVGGGGSKSATLDLQVVHEIFDSFLPACLKRIKLSGAKPTHESSNQSNLRHFPQMNFRKLHSDECPM